jgi:hypothetical protein
MSSEWDSLIRDLAILNGEGNKDQAYKDLCASTALTTLWSIVENHLKPKTKNLLRLRELMEEYETEYYNEVVRPISEAEKKLTHDPDETVVSGIVCKPCGKELPPMTMTEHLNGRGCPCEKKNRSPQLKQCKCGLYQTCDICKKYQER